MRFESDSTDAGKAAIRSCADEQDDGALDTGQHGWAWIVGGETEARLPSAHVQDAWFESGISFCRVETGSQTIAVRPDYNFDCGIALLLVDEGRASYKVNGAQTLLERGDSASLLGWRRYELQIAERAALTLIALPRALLSEQVQEMKDVGWMGAATPIQRAGTPINDVVRSLARFFVSQRSDDAGILAAARFLSRGLVNILVISGHGSPALLLQPERFDQIHQYCCLNLDKEKLSPRVAAEDLKFSLRTLHQECAKNGTTFVNLLNSLRLNHAALLLAQSKMRISEVAFACGYASLPHFCRLFKERHGVSARSFREAIANGMSADIRQAGSDFNFRADGA